MKTLSGAQIPYGSTLPTVPLADGALFYKTSNEGSPQGMYLYGFISDSNEGLLGPQVSQGWIQAASVDLYVQKTGDTMSGQLTVPSFLKITQDAGQQRLLIGNQAASGSNKPGIIQGLDGVVSIGSGSTWTGSGGTLASGLSINSDANTGLTWRGGQVWHAGNHGSVSGLDADLLDGQHGAFYRDATNISSGSLAVAHGGTGTTATAVGGVAYGQSSLAVGYSAVGTATSGSGTNQVWQVLTSGGTGTPAWVNSTSLNAAFASSANTANSATTAGTATALATTRNINLTGGVSGTASFNGTADANITVTTNNVQGFLPATGANPNTLLLRDGSGFAHAVYYHQSSPNNEGDTINQIMYTNGTDGFMRKASLAQAAAAFGGSFVAKGGDTMSGSLAMGSNNITAGSITLNGSSSTISTSVLSATSTISTTAGNITTNSGAIATGINGSTGRIALQSGGATNTGYAEFYNPAGTRQGYIGFGSGSSLQYVAENGFTTHAFSGSITATGNITAYSSDGRLKKNVAVIENAVQKVLSLGGYSYDWDMTKCNEIGFKPENEHEHGLIAQEVQKVMPDAVAPAPFDAKYLTVRYERIVALLTAAIGEQQEQIEELKAQVAELKAK